ncbi:MAG: hypothetical protein GY792_17335 [Gammaproteobacteria bacterium]|nr:hypothetical protein [Gammaproteobacteria bacterium]
MKRIFFIEMMGEPGSYDASVYDHFDDKDKEGLWFVKQFNHIVDISIDTCNVCLGEKLPGPEEVDGLVLAGTYNSVLDFTQWQQKVRNWLPQMRSHKIPILAICGSHQLVSHIDGSDIEILSQGPYAGTFPISLTGAGRTSAIMNGITDEAAFQFANSEHVVNVPEGSTLLASSGRVPVAALDFGDHCYSTQFHPEGSHETLGTVWRYKNPELMENYRPEKNGSRVVENFLELVAKL